MDHIENHISPNCIVDGMSVSEHVKAKRCLVKKLGGYSEAKDILKIRIRAGFNDSVDELEKALLEYRREHGIFEVGDWVVIGEPVVLAQFVGYVHKDTHAELPQININGELFSSYFKAWRHATDEEIKAGHRL